MPITHQLPSAIEPGTTYTAWTWGPRIRIDAGAEIIVIEFESCASAAAAYGGGKPLSPSSVMYAGKAYRNWVRTHTQLYLLHTAAVDEAALLAFPGATVVDAQLPAWASEPIEPDDPPAGGS